jgi:hypothetical protein
VLLPLLGVGGSNSTTAPPQQVDDVGQGLTSLDFSSGPDLGHKVLGQLDVQTGASGLCAYTRNGGEFSVMARAGLIYLGARS